MIGLYILLLCRVYTYQDIDENYGWPVRQYEDVVILICETNFSGFKRQIQTPLPLLYSKASLFSDIFLNNKVPLSSLVCFIMAAFSKHVGLYDAIYYFMIS